MKNKDALKDTISSLFEEYTSKEKHFSEIVKGYEDKISDCDKNIHDLTSRINNDISALSPDDYINIQSEIEKNKKTKEMYEKQLSVVLNSHKFFSSAEDKRDFVSRFRAVYKSEEDEFAKACLVHLEALNDLVMKRNVAVEKSINLASRIGESTIVFPCTTRQIVSNAISTLKYQRIIR